MFLNLYIWPNQNANIAIWLQKNNFPYIEKKSLTVWLQSCQISHYKGTTFRGSTS